MKCKKHVNPCWPEILELVVIYILYSLFYIGPLLFVLKISALSLPLPPKKLIGNMDREFIAERQKGLQNYLNVITYNHMLSNCELVKKFLDPNSYSINYTGK